MKTHRIALTPHGHTMARMFLGWEDLGCAYQPLFAAAREQLRRGIAEPTDRIETWRGETMCLAAPVWAAAKLTTRDDLRFRLYQPDRMAALSGAKAPGSSKTKTSHPTA